MKPGSYTKLYVQLVFAVKFREALLRKAIRNQVFEYMAGICTNIKHKPLIINGVEDHVHILIGLNPAVSISDTVHDIKRGSSLFINNEGIIPGYFNWQNGFGAFSYSKSHLDNVYKYIENQEKHHSKELFRTEYISMIKNRKLNMMKDFFLNFLMTLRKIDS